MITGIDKIFVISLRERDDRRKSFDINFRDFNYEYVDTFKEGDVDHISVLATKLLGGLNKNEINLKEKYTKNLGFFEKFFKFFG